MDERNHFHARVGQLVNDRYKLLRFLGLGGVGMVYLAEDRDLGGLQVALKFLYQHLVASAVSIERLRSEVLIARKLQHPNLVKVYDFERTKDEQYFIAMEYIEGTTLADALRSSQDRRLAFGTVVSTLYEVCSGMGHAHASGVIHRDLKPQNVLITPAGRIAICDFGMARQVESNDGLTRTGEAIGTPHYMAPELFRAEPADERTDVYALGIIAYELVTGVRPFTDEVFYALAIKHIEAPMPPLPAELELPPWFQTFITTATAKPKGERFASAALMAEVLRPHLDENTREAKGQLYRDWQQRECRRIALERRRRRRAVSGVAALVFLVIVWILLIFSRTNARQWWAIAVPILRIERYTGPSVLWPMKRLFGIDIDASEQELRDLVFAHLLQKPPLEASELRLLTFRFRMLLDAGIDPNTKDEKGTPLVVTLVETAHDDIAALFVEHGRFNGKDVRDTKGNPLLHMCIARRMFKLQGMLMEKANLDPAAVDAKGDSALHIAVQTRAPEAMTSFFKFRTWHSATIGIRNHEGRTAVELAALDPVYPAYLLEQMISLSDPNAVDPRGDTPLILAAKAGNAGGAGELLRGGAVLTQRDSQGHTALYYASRQENDATLRRLISRSHSDWIISLIDEIPEEKHEKVKRWVEAESFGRAAREKAFKAEKVRSLRTDGRSHIPQSP